MKTLRQSCVAVILTLALAIPVVAGQVDCPGAVSPPPPPTTTTSSITTTVILAIVSLIK